MKNENQSEKNIAVAFILNFSFSIFELIGGIWTNSVSIISDSIHDFGDCLSIAISWLLEKKSGQKPDKFYTYGYQRFSVLGAMINSFVLFAGALIMLIGAITRILNPAPVNYDGVLFLAVIGLFVNGYGAYKTISGEKISEKAVGLHLLEDVLGWIAVLFAAIVMKIFDCPIIDPILSICITLFILYNVIKNVKKIFEIFLDKSNPNIDIEKLKNKLIKLEKILDVHHLHSWTDGINNFFTLHAIINDLSNKNDIIQIKKNIRGKLADEKINHVTIEIEFESENCNEHECSNIKNENISHSHHH
jgi:cation diffusion facilitator family transporter